MIELKLSQSHLILCWRRRVSKCSRYRECLSRDEFKDSKICSAKWLNFKFLFFLSRNHRLIKFRKTQNRRLWNNIRSRNLLALLSAMNIEKSIVSSYKTTEFLCIDSSFSQFHISMLSFLRYLQSELTSHEELNRVKSIFRDCCSILLNYEKIAKYWRNRKMQNNKMFKIRMHTNWSTKFSTRFSTIY